MKTKQLGRQPYQTVWEEMKAFTAARTPNTPDELWFVEHDPVFTLGQAGLKEHILAENPLIPIIQSDRGGQVTYHGPGQLIAYVLMDLTRQNLGVRTLVCQLEATLIDCLKLYNITADRKAGAPGVYVGDKKIASIGLRVKKGCTYHGIALNVAMDLNPFASINPCGYSGLQMTQISAFLPGVSLMEVQEVFLEHFLSRVY